MRKLLVRKFQAIIFLILLVSSAQAQSFGQFVREPEFKLKVAGSTLDFVTSFGADGVKIREANPLLRRRDGSFAWERKLALEGLKTYAEYRAYRRNPKHGKLYLLIDGVVGLAAGTWNLRLRF